MYLRIAVLGSLLLAGAAVADDDASRAKLIGSWQSLDSTQVWSFQQKGGPDEVIHVTNIAGPKTTMEFDCDSFGHDCTIKINGHTAKVSLYYNGPKLIQMETRGSTILKRVFLVTGEGDTMDMVQDTIAPNPKTETVHFKRVAATATH